MASTQQPTLFSPAELAYLHSSLSLRPPIRPDGRSARQFRPLTAETGILPGTHGSARVCLADGTEAIVGVKAEVERTATTADEDYDDERETEVEGGKQRRHDEWIELTVEIPGLRDDDAATVFLAEMLREALLADGGTFAARLRINRRFHWRLYLDILLISPPLSYPLPLLSLTTHLALLATRLPRLRSEGDEDPLFDDDWDASAYLYPRRAAAADDTQRRETAGSASGTTTTGTRLRPPVTLLVVAVGGNTIFDPSREELAVADTALAVSVAQVESSSDRRSGEDGGGRQLRLLALRTVDPPSRMTPPGVPLAGGGGGGGGTKKAEGGEVMGVWRAPVGGMRLGVVDGILRAVLEGGGVADEVLDGLEGVEL